MSALDQQNTTLEVRRNNIFERAQQLPTFMDEWEKSVLDRLDLVEGVSTLDREFLRIQLHKEQLAMLGTYGYKAMIRKISAVGRAQAFHSKANDFGIELSPETALYPETLAEQQITELSDERGETFHNELDDFIMLMLTEAGERANPPIELFPYLANLTLQHFDNRISSSEKVNMHSIIHNLEQHVSKPQNTFKLSPAEQKVFDTLLPLTSRKPIERGTNLAASTLSPALGIAMKYVYHKTVFHALYDEIAEKFLFDAFDDVLPSKKHIGAPNALDTSIMNTYHKSEVTLDSLHRYRQPDNESLLLAAKYAGIEVEQSPGNVLAFYFWEHFPKGVAKLYDYPDVLDFF